MQPRPSLADRRFFGRNASILLDVLRFAAALAVAMSHMPHHFVLRGNLISERFGNAAVCVFFVLSGFVIRYVTVARQTSGREYCIDRASRIYSVVVPALLLTALLEGAALLIAPGAYHHIADVFRWREVPLQFLENLTFTVGWWGFGATPLSNGPFWSLSFECVYYALYGLLYYTPRARWVAVPLLLLLAGPSIALLFSVWLFGAVLHDAYLRLHKRSDGLPLALGALAVYLAALFPSRHRVLQLLRNSDVSERTTALTHAVSSTAWGRNLFHGATLHWLDRLSTSFFLTGSLLAVAMLPLMLALDKVLPAASKRAAARIRVIADSTFTLYVLHVPMFILLIVLTGGPWKTWHTGLFMLLIIICLSILLARVFDRGKDAMRTWLRRYVPATGTLNADRKHAPTAR